MSTQRSMLVTGGAAGLGLAIARAAHDAGYRVATVDPASRGGDDGDVTSNGAASNGAGSIRRFADSVSDEAAVEAVLDAFGTPDVVVNNAGIVRFGPLLGLATDDFRAVLDINVTGAFLTVREGARRMMAAGSKDTGRGRIVIIASIGAHKVLPGLAAYCASKAAVAHMGRTLAREWANKGVNVNVVCPGYIETELNADWFASEGGKKQVSGFPRRRLMVQEDLDPAISWLTSDASKAVTGSVITVDDGQSI